MATRRSRIKAVANVPARRNRPSSTNDALKETLDAIKSESICPPDKGSNEESIVKNSIPTENIKDHDSSSHSESTPDTQATPDRKSVIVTDRKSVIVNRDDCISTSKSNLECKAESSISVNLVCEEESKNVSVSSSKFTLISEVETDHGYSGNTSISDTITAERPVDVAVKEVPSDILQGDKGKQNQCETGEDTEDSANKLNTKDSIANTSIADKKSSQNNRAPLRNRRTKPTVNLTAAIRKRPGNDLVASSPLSPPPNKLKPSELMQRQNSESENNNSIVPSTKVNDRCQQSEALDSDAIRSKSQETILPLPPISEEVSSKPSCKTSGHFKVPVSSPLKNKENAQVPTSDNPTKVDGITPIGPHKETSGTKRKPSTNALRVAAARKNLKSKLTTDGPLPRASLTMFDLIFYNPSKNPMKSTDSLPVKSRGRLNSVSSVSSIHEDRLNEESVDDVDEGTAKEDDVEETAMPVPQVKVGPDGSLILDEQSLVIETTGTKKNREELERSEIVVETGASYGHYKKIVRSKEWSNHETKKFYRALNVVGTDFSLMKPYFRNRTRRELKLKFKKEEKLNLNLVSKAIGEPVDFDISELEKECELEEEEEKRLEELAKEKAAQKLQGHANDAEERAKKAPKKKRPRRSFALAEMEDIIQEGTNPKKPAPKTATNTAKISQDPNANADYSMLATGVEVPENNSNEEPKKQSEESLKKPKPKRTRKKIVHHPGLTLDNIQQASNNDSAVPADNISAPPQKLPHTSNFQVPQMPSTTSSASNNGPAVPAFNSNATGQKLPTTSNFRTPLVPSTTSPRNFSTPVPQRPPTSSPHIFTTGIRAIDSSIQSQIQIAQESPHNTPQRGAPVKGVVMVSPKTFMRQPQPPTTSPATKSSVTESLTTSGLSHVSKLPPGIPVPSSVRTIQVPTVSPSMSTPVSKVVSTPSPSRIRTLPVTPQTVPNSAAVGVTTPVSRLLPSTPQLPRMEPGSIIVLKTPLANDPNRHVLQVFMVTNTPPGSSPSGTIPVTPHLPGINLLSGPTVQPASVKSPCISDDSDCEKVLTSL